MSARDRGLVVLAALAPDLDGLGIIAEVATRHSETPLLWWSDFHHILAHNLLFACLLAAAAWWIARKPVVVLIVFLNVHLHLLGDLIGGRGPDGAQWPVAYLWPVSGAPELTVSWQWHLNAWPNIALTVLLLVHLFWIAWRRGISPLQFVSARANQVFVETLRNRVARFGK